MTLADAKDSETHMFVKTYEVQTSRMILAIGLTIICLYLPALSIWELITTGTIDLDAVGKGRREIPIWQLYLTSWIIGPPLFFLNLAPIIYHYMMDFHIKISQESILTPRKKISINKIAEVSRTGWKNCLKISLHSGQEIILPSVFGKSVSDEIELTIRTLLFPR